MITRFVSFHHSDIVHAADSAMQPICSQTDTNREANWQADIGPVTCHRCLRLIRVERVERQERESVAAPNGASVVPHAPDAPDAPTLPTLITTP